MIAPKNTAPLRTAIARAEAALAVTPSKHPRALDLTGMLAALRWYLKTPAPGWEFDTWDRYYGAAFEQACEAAERSALARAA